MKTFKKEIKLKNNKYITFVFYKTIRYLTFLQIISHYTDSSEYNFSIEVLNFRILFCKSYYPF